MLGDDRDRAEDETPPPIVPPEKRLSLFRETSIPRKRLMRPSRQQNPVVMSIVDDIVEKAIEFDDAPRATSTIQKRVCVPDEDLCINEGWCSVCNGGESTPGDLIVYCDMCGIPVHQSCYGVPVVPKGSWNCQRCTALLVTNQSPSSMICAICHRYGGAMKPLRRIQRVTTSPEWVHVLCVWWDHDVVVPNMQVMEPLQMVHPPMNNRQRSCMICFRNEGYLIQCHWNQCNAWFHAICARFGDANKIHCHRDEPQRHLGGGFLQVEIEEGHRAAFHGYCPRHATQEFGLDDVVTKLIASGHISDSKIARAVEKLPTTTPDPDEQLAALGKWLVKYAEQSMASVPSLQLLQILVDHLPQIYKTYPSTTIQLHDLLGGAWIEKLHATFGRRADDPFDYCVVCEEPLTHLDHGFYCTHAHRPHLQHWSCQAKPVVVTAAATARKKKAKATRSSKAPNPSALIAEGRAAAAAIAALPPGRDTWPEAAAMVCGVCSLPMDHRAVAVSKNGGFHVPPYVETTAVYANQGQFVNDQGSSSVEKAPTPAKAATNSLPPSDRFRVERGIKLVREIQTLLSNAKTYQATQDETVYTDMCTQLTAIIEWIKPVDAYAGDKLTKVHAMFVSKRGPGMALLQQLVRDYTKLLHAKHVRAVDKAAQDQRKRDMESVLESERLVREQVEAESERARKADLQRAKKRERERERKRLKSLAAAAAAASANTTPSATPPPPAAPSAKR